MYNAWLIPCVSHHNAWCMRLMKRGEIAQWLQRCSRNTHDGPLCCVSKACIYKSVKYSVLRERATLSLRGVPHTMRLRFISQFESLKQAFKKKDAPLYTPTLALSVAIFMRTIGNYVQAGGKSLL